MQNRIKTAEGRRRLVRPYLNFCIRNLKGSFRGVFGEKGRRCFCIEIGISVDRRNNAMNYSTIFPLDC